MMKSKRYGVMVVVLFLICGWGSNGLAQEKRKPVVVPGKTFLPLRILARPFSNIYKAADEKSPVVEENVSVFQSYYVYTRPAVSTTGTTAEGWYEVGKDNRGSVLGWMKAADVMEWKQTMCLAYTHPSGRHPVLMFEKVEPLRDLIKAPDDKRSQTATGYYQTLETGKIPQDFPIVSKEPKDYVDIVEQFYLLPILEHSPVEIKQGVEGRLLKIAAATKSERGGGTLKQIVASTSGAAPAGTSLDAASLMSGLDTAKLKGLQMDVVYVMDMTNSMQPYIDMTLKAIKDMSLKMEQEVAKSVKFGLWGYRDSLDIKGLEFLTKNFTPELQPESEFEKTLLTAKAARVGSEGYPEDVFSGVDDVMRQTKWTEGAIKMIVLVGDAPSHTLGEKWNASGKGENELRQFADAAGNNFFIFALHIKSPEGKDFDALTEQQFRALSQNPGLDEASYWSVASTDNNGFANTSIAIADTLVKIVKAAKEGKIAAPASAATAPSAAKSAQPQETQETVSEKVAKMGYAALVEWIGREKGAKSPSDVTAWITDKDLLDPDIQAMDVRILISKNELDSLKTALQEIMVAGRRGMIGGEAFFTALQSIPTVATRAGEQIKNAKTIAESGLLPEFMLDLPYQSRIMNMSNELWASWGQEQQEEFLNEIDAKLKLYAAIHDNPNGWIALNEGDDPSEHVTPVSIESLP